MGVHPWRFVFEGREVPLSAFFLGYIADIFLANEHSGAMDGKADTEAIAVVISDAAVEALAVFQHDGNLGPRINQGFQIIGFRSRLLRADKIVDVRHFP